MIEGSSNQEITGDGTGKALPEINEYYTKEHYDEFKQSDDNVIEMKKEAEKIEKKSEQPDTKPEQTPTTPEGQIRICDMTREQLENTVVNLMNIQKRLESTVKEYEARAKRIQQIWNSKEEVKRRYFMLRDNPKAKGVRVI